MTQPPFELQPILRGELLELRPLTRHDFDALFAAASDPLIWQQHPERDRYRREVFQRYFDGAIDSKGGIRDYRTQVRPDHWREDRRAFSAQRADGTARWHAAAKCRLCNPAERLAQPGAIFSESKAQVSCINHTEMARSGLASLVQYALCLSRRILHHVDERLDAAMASA